MAMIRTSQARADVGILLPTRDSVTADRPTRDIIDVAVDAERLGYDSVWVGDSVVARPRHEPFTVLAAVAAATNRVRIGTAVLIAPLRHPVHLAHAASTVDALSDGRLVLGVGIGPSYGRSRKEFATLGVPFERRLARTLEGIALSKRLWAGDAVTFDGEFHTTRKVEIRPKPVQPGGPPVWLGGTGPRSREAAALMLDGWLPGPVSPEQFGDDLRGVRAAARTAGRGPEAVAAAIYVSAMVDDGITLHGDRSAVLRATLEAYYRQPYELVASLNDTFLGPASEAAAWLQRYAEAGAEHIIVRLLGPDTDVQMRGLASALSA